MMFKEHLSKSAGFSDKLNYAHFVDEGLIINKDGAFLVSYKFKGPDMHSASEAELNALTENFNRMVTFLEDGWMLHMDEVRIPSVSYPERGAFPDSVSSLIDEERRVLYESEGGHFENFQFLTFVWKFPLPLVKTAKHWFVEGLVPENDQINLNKLLVEFNEKVDHCVGLLSSELYLEKLNSKDMLSYLNVCISGELNAIDVPPDGSFIDVVLSRKPVSGGYVPKIGDKHLYVLSMTGYFNRSLLPGVLKELGTYPLVYRWSNRFIPFSEETAEREIKRFQRNWNNKVKGLVGTLKEAFTNTSSTKLNHDALEMSQETDEALTSNGNGSTRYGYWTSEIVLMNEDRGLLDQATKDITRYLEQAEFSCYRETINVMDAWLGTVPGHGSCNVRRLFVNSLNLAYACPLHTVWAGASCSSPASLLPPYSPPVFYAATTGKTPFRFNMDVADVGHQVILGPTGAGKSTYLGFLIAQFLRYPKAQIFVFDKDYSHQALTVALGGFHYDIGNASSLSFCPLFSLETATHKLRAAQFIEDLVLLQNIPMTPAIRLAIHTAIEALAMDQDTASRNLTVFQSLVQNAEVRAALHFYTLDGSFKLLDASKDSLQTGYLQTFEMGWLLSQKPEIYLPVLRHIFDQIESRIEEGNGENPTIIVLEEAWLYIEHPVFASKLKDWLKTMRKKNVRVVFATQSLADLYDPSTKSLTSATAAIMESCPTKVYLANASMDAELKELYQKMGLTERQIEIISREAVPKRHYYVVTPEGNRLIELGLDTNSVALAFIGLSKKKSKALLECKAQQGDRWVYEWLMHNNLNEWAHTWLENNTIERRMA